MGARYRICETCVYCSLAGDCDRYDKPLTSIEQPACDAYEIHPLIDENAKLRELVWDLWSCSASLAEDSIYHIEGAVCGCGINCVVNGEDCSAYKLRDRMRELGVEV